jgi:hypothetical protein
MRDLHRRWMVFLLVALLASAIDLLASYLLRNPTLGSNVAARIAIALMPLPGDIALIR